MDLLKSSHSVTEIVYHFTFIPKYRRRRLVGNLKQTLLGMIKFCAQVNEWKILELNIQPDHVHLLIQTKGNDCPSEIMQLIKGGTSKKLREMYPGLVENTFAKSFWADEYYCGTVGKRDLEQVSKYVRDQDKHYVKEPG
ncbi:IS200/IS605 family transposase [Candidatus Daviesbacteria bacterium]|nr:IS200/IS605 family transposase [Candidatus Daviesbacteria bacterium]